MGGKGRQIDLNEFKVSPRHRKFQASKGYITRHLKNKQERAEDYFSNPINRQDEVNIIQLTIIFKKLTEAGHVLVVFACGPKFNTNTLKGSKQKRKTQRRNKNDST